MGGLCLEGLNALFHKVNPLLEAFFQSIVDGDADVTVSDADAVSPSTARRAICNPSLTAIHSSSSTPRHNSIQPASHTVHSTTSPTDNI